MHLGSRRKSGGVQGFACADGLWLARCDDTRRLHGVADNGAAGALGVGLLGSKHLSNLAQQSVHASLFGSVLVRSSSEFYICLLMDCVSAMRPPETLYPYVMKICDAHSPG